LYLALKRQKSTETSDFFLLSAFLIWRENRRGAEAWVQPGQEPGTYNLQQKEEKHL
jgi:hypothetical protein